MPKYFIFQAYCKAELDRNRIFGYILFMELNRRLLKETRKKKGMTLAVLAQMVSDDMGKKISRQAFYGYESGRYSPLVETLRSLCRVLELDPKEVMSGNGDGVPSGVPQEVIDLILLLDGEEISHEEIARRLNEEEIPAGTGRKWSPILVTRVVESSNP